MLSVDIIDNHFSHNDCSSGPWQRNDLFVWNRRVGTNSDLLFLTDNSLHLVDRYSATRKVAWLMESPVITPSAYDYIKHNFEKFDYVLTHSKELLDLSKSFLLCPFGGCWIYPSDYGLHSKSKLVSLIMSNKNTTQGQRLRHQIKQTPLPINVDIYEPLPSGYQYKLPSLKEYKFQIVVENCKQDYYFSEKLIDCLVTGTIPIYWGCPSINLFFDTEGFLCFDTIDELNKIITSTDLHGFYESKKSIVEKNFMAAQRYTLCEQYMYKNFNELFPV